jgi:hypothetical protein
MRPADDIEKSIKNLNITAPAEMRQRVLGDLLKLMEESKKKRPSAYQPIVWRIIMKSRVTKFAAAAVTIAALLAGIQHFTGPIHVASVAWGDVVKTVEQAESVVLRMTSMTTLRGKDEKVLSTEAIAYLSTKYGSRTDTFINGELHEKRYRIAGENVGYWVWPKEKRYLRRVLKQEDASEEQRKSDPREWVKEILAHDYVDLGRDNIDGTKVQGVEVHKPMMGGDKGVVRLWVDVETNLPVRIETQDTVVVQGKEASVEIVLDDFKWNTELASSVFEPDIGADYSTGKH